MKKPMDEPTREEVSQYRKLIVVCFVAILIGCIGWFIHPILVFLVLVVTGFYVSGEDKKLRLARETRYESKQRHPSNGWRN